LTVRVLAVIPSGCGPASMVFSHRQIDALKSFGHTVEIFKLLSQLNPLKIFLDIFRYRTEIRRFRPDIVHAQYGTMTAFFSVYAAFKQVPKIVTFRGSDLNPVPSMSLIRVGAGHLLSQMAALGADGIICVSDQLCSRLWWKQSLVTLVPTGVSTNEFYPIRREEARRRLGWDIEVPTVIFNAGSSPEVKRLDLALAVIEFARLSLPDIRFVVLDGTIMPAIVPMMMNASDCLLCTSDFEGSPAIIQEAMACNVPIVSVPVGDVPERLRDVTHSYIVSMDPQRLGAALVDVLRTRPRTNGHEIVLRDVGIEPIVRALEAVYAAAMVR
jgi:teichuronic acid biosynthesis glycosyltransferase TuaC